MKTIEKIHQWIIKVLISIALVFAMSCQQKTGNEIHDYSDVQGTQQERNNLCEELETLYDIATPVKAKKVQKKILGYSIRGKLKLCYLQIKRKRF